MNILESLRPLPLRRYWCRRGAPHVPAMLVAATLFALLLTVRQLGWLEPLELRTFDVLLGSQTMAPPHPQVLVVGIGEADIQALRQWPLDDALLARAVANLRAHGAAMVGLDIYRDFPHEPGHAELRAALQDPGVIAVTKLSTEANPTIAAPPGVPPTRIGFSDLILDADGVVRRGLLYAKGGQQVQTAFAMQLALNYLRQQGLTPRDHAGTSGFELGKGVIEPLDAHAGGYRNLDNAGFQILLNYRRQPQPAEQVSFMDVLENRVDAEQIRGRIVLIGSTAESIKDVYFTPFSQTAREQVQMPGVMIHAHILGQLLDTAGTANQLRFWPQWAEWLWLVLWGTVGALAAWRARRLLLLQAVALGGLGALLVCHWLVFRLGVWIPLWDAVLAFFCGGLSILGGRLAYQSLHDPLTRLPNRANLTQRLRYLQRRRPRQDVALILVELERYRLINAVFGPQSGDLLLVEMARRLCRVADEYGQVSSHHWCGDLLAARADGAQFALLMSRADARETAQAIGKTLLQRCSEPFEIAGEEVFPTAIVGIALGNPSYQGNLLRDAHAALSRASALGNTLEIVDGEIKAEEIEAFQVERELHGVVRKSQGDLPHLPEFAVYYQPIVSLQTGRISGFEALVRWQHPQRGLVPPFKFIPVAEHSGMIVPIGNWVLLDACRQMQAWRTEFPDLLISVNLAAPQLIHPETLGYLERILQVTGLPPSALKLEITESATIQHLDIALKVLGTSRSLGVNVAIDDFGTGYSSLAYLTKFPVDILKIDMAFVRNMDASLNDFSILRAIVDLAKKLGLKIIAEGIETPRHLEILRELQCDYGQGYLFAKPQTAADTEALLRSEPVW
ncbi:EAL domain-containing protein [Allochromatium humboldtianum]|uniref:EAL domain-containing protein n=1 Tax=Allochromatium humboldtianum TaxID=504901 RepID=A0A850RQG5_9GAMM|nr:EAL domain-containing protein [Allochromatium humboldtianum]NVZ11771.1 EAL domain-containing protein [Allochromatium humboldtianum]